ncbi:MAG: hypothetical protein ACK5RS_02480, partial [Acidobacteriota bacterium]
MSVEPEGGEVSGDRWFPDAKVDQTILNNIARIAPESPAPFGHRRDSYSQDRYKSVEDPPGHPDGEAVGPAMDESSQACDELVDDGVHGAMSIPLLIFFCASAGSHWKWLSRTIALKPPEGDLAIIDDHEHIEGALRVFQ